MNNDQSREISLIDLIHNVSKEFVRELNIRLAKYNVTYAQWRFLLFLWQQEGLTQKALSQRVGIEPATTVRTLDRMERDELIRRHRSERDRREINIFLTPKGKELYPVLAPICQELEKQVVKSMDEQEIAQCVQGISKLLKKFSIKH